MFEPKLEIEHALQTLINTKHLYQTIEVNFDEVVKERARPLFAAQGLEMRSPLADIETNVRSQILRKHWILQSPGVPLFREAAGDSIVFSLRPVKTMCGACHTIESFNSWAGSPASSIFIDAFEAVFCIPVQCQACKSNVIMFLVRRSGTKLQQAGRSEFEEVEVPKFIGKSFRKFYSQSVVAFQSGQVLAGLFMLRILIEQHMRAVTADSEKMRGDELCDAYAASLPDDFKRSFPSLKEIYGKLSNAMHEAKADHELFELQRKEIERHFDALRLFGLHQS